MRFPRCLALILLLTSSCQVLGTGHALARQEASGSATVYVTRTGSKYHQAGCSSLSRSAIPMRLDEAAARYGPCSRCRPPVWQPSSLVSKRPLPPPPAPTANVSEADVFLAVGGAVYHRDRDCKGLAGRQTVTRKLSDVHTPEFGMCSVCGSSPGVTTGLTAPPPPTPSGRSATSSVPVSSGRCQAITKKGTQCSRKAQPGSSYCWQHQK
jgi:hypothetical protein